MAYNTILNTENIVSIVKTAKGSYFANFANGVGVGIKEETFEDLKENTNFFSLTDRVALNVKFINFVKLNFDSENATRYKLTVSTQDKNGEYFIALPKTEENRHLLKDTAEKIFGLI
jgi:hypothetical protein